VRIAVLALVAFAAAGCGEKETQQSTSPSSGATSLTIEISPGKGEGLTKSWTLMCPDGGTLPNPEQACEQLDAVDKPFAPVPKDVSCTEVYGGPQVATVSGTYQGRPVSTTFTRTNGCEIARWNQVRFLFPES
jgi:hypothetical protein